MILIYVFIIIVIGIQVIYIRYADIPFYYKEIIYDWNYTTTKNTKLSLSTEWINLLWNKNGYIHIEQNLEKLYGLQTNLFSFQKDVEVHNHLNMIVFILSILMCLYIFYITVNTFAYKHEKKKVEKFLIINILLLLLIITMYNTEVLTTVLYKTNFLYTDNIYITNQNKLGTANNILLGILLICYYIITKGKEQINKTSKYYLYLLYIVINIIDENVIIGIEYLYLICYMEIILLLINALKNRRTDG